MNRVALIATSLALLACGPIRGEVIEGRGGGSRAAGNLAVIVYDNPDVYFARCEIIRDAELAGVNRRAAFADSVRKALGAKLDGHRQVDLTTDYRLDNLLYGDAAAAIIANRDSALARLPGPRHLWSGRTDVNGRFSSKWLTMGEYVVVVDGHSRRVKAGWHGASSQITYVGFPLPGCYAEPGKLRDREA